MKRAQPMTAPRMLEAVVKAPGQKPRVTLISDTREALSSIVGGRIEMVSFTEGNVIICNEEGRLMKLPRT